MTSTNTSATLNLLYDSTVTKIGLLVMIFDSSLYNAALTYFSYTMPPGVNSPQTFAVTDTENHMASFLVGLHATLGPFPSGYAPQADSFILVDTASIISANLSITYDPGQLSIINYIVLFVDFQISLFIASPYAGYGQQFAIYGTSGFAT